MHPMAGTLSPELVQEGKVRAVGNPGHRHDVAGDAQAFGALVIDTADPGRELDCACLRESGDERILAACCSEWQGLHGREVRRSAVAGGIRAAGGIEGQGVREIVSAAAKVSRVGDRAVRVQTREERVGAVPDAGRVLYSLHVPSCRTSHRRHRR